MGLAITLPLALHLCLQLWGSTVATDWLNPLLDRARLWARLESGLDAIGLTPNRGTK